MKAKPSPMIRVAMESMGMVITSVMIRMPLTRITKAGIAWPKNTIGFLRIRSAITPPMGEMANMAIPEPIWASPAAALLPVILNATLGTSMNDIMKPVVASVDPDQNRRKSR